jgi:hypothetical protein
MRRLALLGATLLVAVLALGRGPLSADACSCPWEVRQLTSTNNAGDCATAQLNAKQNAGTWAEFACNEDSHGNGHVCTYVWTDLGCSVDGSGTATDTSLVNFKCTICP